jgi:hypothetical protein
LTVLFSAWWKGRKPLERQPPGIELTTDFGSKWPLTMFGRIDPPQERRRVHLGEGPDTLSLVALGRKPEVRGGVLQFGEVSAAAAGRVVMDVDVEGEGLSLSADIDTQPPARGPLTPFRELFIGPPAVPKSALLLLGEPGRYVALLVTGDNEAPVLEWALGNARRGLMSSPARLVGPGPHRLEIHIDPYRGELHAYVGSRENRRLVGDPLSLGRGWRRLFGKMPQAALGCLDGACRFDRIQFEVEQAPAPQPPPPPPTVAVETPAPSTPKRSGNTSKPSVSPTPSKRPANRKR